MFVRVYVCMYIRMFVCMYIYIYIYIYNNPRRLSNLPGYIRSKAAAIEGCAHGERKQASAHSLNNAQTQSQQQANRERPRRPRGKD